MPQNESEIIELCLLGDRKAWVELVRRYKRLVIHCLRNELPTAGREEIEDLTQDVFLSLFKRGLKKYDPIISRFSTYLGTIAVNRARDYRKSRIYRERRTYELLPEAPPTINPPDSLPDESSFDLDSALKSLPPEELSYIRLYFYEEGMTLQSIAALKGIHFTTVSRRLKKIFKKIKEYAKKEK